MFSDTLGRFPHTKIAVGAYAIDTPRSFEVKMPGFTGIVTQATHTSITVLLSHGDILSFAGIKPTVAKGTPVKGGMTLGLSMGTVYVSSSRDFILARSRKFNGAPIDLNKVSTAKGKTMLTKTSNIRSRWPISDEHGQPFAYSFASMNRTVKGKTRPHDGVDIQVKPTVNGETIRSATAKSFAIAVDDGLVIRAEPVNGYGLLVTVRHDDVLSTYAHLASLLVKVGDKVQAGTRLGRIGGSNYSSDTGMLTQASPNGDSQSGSYSAHLHFELRHVDASRSRSDNHALVNTYVKSIGLGSRNSQSVSQATAYSLNEVLNFTTTDPKWREVFRNIAKIETGVTDEFRSYDFPTNVQGATGVFQLKPAVMWTEVKAYTPSQKFHGVIRAEARHGRSKLSQADRQAYSEAVVEHSALNNTALAQAMYAKALMAWVLKHHPGAKNHHVDDLTALTYFYHNRGWYAKGLGSIAGESKAAQLLLQKGATLLKIHA